MSQDIADTCLATSWRNPNSRNGLSRNSRRERTQRALRARNRHRVTNSAAWVTSGALAF
jgi:hypothetical protein